MRGFFSKVARASKTDFVKVSSWSAVSTVVRMLTGIVSVKVVAHIVGPAGIAMVGQFLNSITMISTFATGGIGQGVTKYIAENYDNTARQQAFIRHASRITLVVTLCVSLLTAFFSRSLSIYIFDDPGYQYMVILLGVSLILFSFNSLFLSILNGYKTFRKFVVVNILTSFFSLALSLFLVLEFHLEGALLNCVLSQSIIIIVTIAYIRKEPWFKEVFKSPAIDKGILKKLGGFTLMTLVSAFLTPFAQITIRSRIVDEISIQSAGIWEGMNRVAAMFLLVITTSISTYYLPRLAEIRDDRVLRNEILKTARILLPTLAVGCILIFFLRDVVIWAVFTKEFSPMRDLFAMQMTGSFFKIATFLLGYLFWAKGMTRHYILTELFFTGTLIILSYAGIDRFGVEGAVYAYALNYLMYFITLIFIFRELFFPKTHIS